MTEPLYDLAVVGGGPAGLMCGLTGVTGIPINPPRHFKGIVLDAHEMASFARYGKLRITHQWHYQGGKLMRFLEDEVARSRLHLRPHTRVSEVDLLGEEKRLVTNVGTIRARKVALCVGFFPYGFLARHTRQVRISFSPPSIEAPHLPETAGSRVGVLGRGEATLSFAAALQELRPDLALELLLDQPPLRQPELPATLGEPIRFVPTETGIEIGFESGRLWSGDFLVVDYDAYTRNTPVTRFLNGTGILLKEGYIRAGRMGGTGLPGVVAAGNIVTPVSGVLTALDTGFHAGLTVYDELHRERFDEPSLVFPWLPREGLEAHPLFTRPEEEVDDRTGR